MSYIAKAEQNRVNAEKARAFDESAQQQRDQQTYDAGATDAYTDVERALMARAAMQQPVYGEPQNLYAPPESTYSQAPVRGEGLAASIQQNIIDNAYSKALMQAQQDGNMSEEYINILVDRELSKLGGL
jgi:hypothetical protein